MEHNEQQTNERQLTVEELPSLRGTGDNSVYLDEDGFLSPQYGQITPPPKHWYQSKTIWFNVISGGAALASSATPALENMLTAVDFAILLAVVNLINAVLRKFTNKPIKGGGNG
ncbi:MULTISPECIES: hypothetical protein [unclassified Psychrobacter]|uniref:hypothetical protein n=1 Tax=unclassified Psychrobacter TaxID=196806 RepID=UPI0018F5359C|nr:MULTISPECIES: hypothetical protein [unclassified Psychrobacter]